MWERINKLIKPNGAIVLFGSEPFSSALRMSNIKNYKYDWIWDKKNANWWLLVKKQPMKRTENISIFYKKQCTYNFQLEEKEKKYIREIKKEYKNIWIYSNETKINFFAPSDKTRTIPINKKYPSNIISISSGSHKKRIHPTQKPVALMEYLIKTYTNEWETVLDFTAWSWTLWCASQNTNRKFICIEKDEGYFNIMCDRLKENQKRLNNLQSSLSYN
jgi:DNA modification methylase